jgi:hypothetical protein
MRLFSPLWLVFSFVIVSFVWADQAFSQTCDSSGMWCPYPGSLEGKYPNCQCVYPQAKPCGPCDIEIGHRCVPATCPPPGFTQNVPATRNVNRSLRPRVQRSIDQNCLGDCVIFCGPDCEGKVGAALAACLRACRGACRRDCTISRR